MKIWKVILVILVLGATVGAMAGCSSAQAETTTDDAVATVSRGNVSVDITAAGNLALAHTEDLAFEVAGTVVEVLVSEGDSVTKGQELAKLDTAEWDKQLKTLERAVVTAQHTLETRQNAVTTARRQVTALERQVLDKEAAVATAQRQVTAKELAVREAELAIATAEAGMESIGDVQEAQAAIDGAEMQLEVIKAVLKGAAGGGAQVTDIAYWNLQKTRAAEQLADAQDILQEILNGAHASTTEEVKLQVAQASLQVDKKKLALEDAGIALNNAKLDVEDARIAVDDAEYAVEQAKSSVTTAEYNVDDTEGTLADAEEALDEAKSRSPVISAPFDGFISKVNVEGGDEVLKGTVAMQLADPNKFEAEILVSEMDITQLQVGGRATVQADALSNAIFPASVTYVSPTATIQSGVVNYTVKVEVENTVTANATTPSVTTDNTTSGLTPFLQRAVDAGRMTQEQAEEMMKNGATGGFTPPEGFTPAEGFTPPEGFTFNFGQGGASSGQLPSSLAAQEGKLRDGLTVTVTVSVARSIDVLVVPNSAVTTQAGKSYVKVITASGEAEQREVVTGLSDWQYTEITSGLAEGDKVSAPRNTAPDSQFQGGPMFFGPPG
jgi:multidrug efflux pump subunit AcrA (membrane-fusion protein)